jgi:hypothetical protein
MRYLAALTLLAACSNDPAFTPCDPDAPDPCPPGYGCTDRVSLDAAPHCTPYCAGDSDCEGIGSVVSWADATCANAGECEQGEPDCGCSNVGAVLVCRRAVCHVRCIYDSDCGDAVCVDGACGVER